MRTLTLPATREQALSVPEPRPVRVCFLIDELAMAGTETQLLALIRHLDRKLSRFRAPSPGAMLRTRVHGIFLRLEAAGWESRNDRTKAAEAVRQPWPSYTSQRASCQCESLRARAVFLF